MQQATETCKQKLELIIQCVSGSHNQIYTCHQHTKHKKKLLYWSPLVTTTLLWQGPLYWSPPYWLVATILT